MKYYEPINVISPKDFIKIVEILDSGDEESYALAIIEWEGVKQIAIRWNVARREWDDFEKQNERKICVGMPSSHGYPVWFVLPTDLLKILMSGTDHILKTKLEEIILKD